MEHIELPAKLIDYFLRSNKATSINVQCIHCAIHCIHCLNRHVLTCIRSDNQQMYSAIPTAPEIYISLFRYP